MRSICFQYSWRTPPWRWVRVVNEDTGESQETWPLRWYMIRALRAVSDD